ncbi:MAG: class D sortase, partial [Lachnospiraceae bacterium]|nr:class D sortase [Lachnospiraceae bacterium]
VPTQTAAPTQAEGSREPALTGEGTPQNVPNSPAPTQAEENGGNAGGNMEVPDESGPTPAGSGEAEENLTGEPTPTQQPDDPGQEEADANKPNRLNNRTVIGVIQIEAIDLIYAIVEGTETEDIGVAIGHMSETAGLGEIGNCALAGHRGGYSGPYFKDIDKLKKGDSVVITKAGGQSFEYKVTESFIVEPTEIWVVEDTGEDKAVLTLVTCEDNGDTRLIVRCEMEE